MEKAIPCIWMCLLMCSPIFVSCGDDEPAPNSNEINNDDGNKEDENKDDEQKSNTDKKDNAPKGAKAIDLGLPSGTLWANMNVGANTPEGYGSYFAWGETSPKSRYLWNNYKWCKGNYDELTKYCPEGDYGTIDTRKRLTLEDDAAYVNWGGTWHMPTVEQFKELRTKCDWIWTTQNNIEGCRVEGINGNSIFLPAAGFCGTYLDYLDGDYVEVYKDKYRLGLVGFYWTNTVCTDLSYCAELVYFSSDEIDDNGYSRCDGLSVRSVCNP